MSNQSTKITIEFLQAFADAWNRHDVDDHVVHDRRLYF